jgi:hypothetical protein
MVFSIRCSSRVPKSKNNGYGLCRPRAKESNLPQFLNLSNPKNEKIITKTPFDEAQGRRKDENTKKEVMVFTVSRTLTISTGL